MKHLHLNELSLTKGQKVAAIRTNSFFGAFEEEGAQVTLTFNGYMPLTQTGPIYFGRSRDCMGYEFSDSDGNYVILCPLNSMGCGDKSVYSNCYGDGNYQLVA